MATRGRKWGGEAGEAHCKCSCGFLYWAGGRAGVNVVMNLDGKDYETISFIDAMGLSEHLHQRQVEDVGFK